MLLLVPHSFDRSTCSATQTSSKRQHVDSNRNMKYYMAAVVYCLIKVIHSSSSRSIGASTSVLFCVVVHTGTTIIALL